jgi:release factor glutamine methyltransferase
VIAAGANGAAGTDAPRTVLDYLRRATVFLAERECASPRLDAEVLLAEVLASDRVGVYLRFDRPLAAAEVERYRTLVRRRGEGEPVAYLTGRREFWSRAVAVTPAVLIPRPETEVLVEGALAAVGERDRALRILDLGTGSGALALALAAELPNARVLALDVSIPAATLARANVADAGLADRVAVAVADWTAPLASSASFDLVVSNPPYVETAALEALPREVRHEPALALDGGSDGLAAYRRLIPPAAGMLAPGGSLLLEVGMGQAPAVADLVAAAGLVAVARHPDLAGIERVVAATAPAASGGA